jgi:hypothetical protein
LSCKKEKQKTTSPSVSTEAKKDTLISSKIKLDNFHIFGIYPLENGEQYEIFISLSDIYHDSISIPPEIINDQKNLSFAELKQFELPPLYRKKLLKGSHLSESDTLYLYNYKSNIMEKLPIKNLKAMANLNGYTSEGEEIYEQDYMIGFQINKLENQDNAMDKANFTLAYFGNQNPFNNQPLESMQWQQVSSNKFPAKMQHPNLKPENVYQYQTADRHYFLLDLMRDANVTERKLVVLKKGKIIFEKIYTKGEGAEFIDLNAIENAEYNDHQWTGSLFKGKPPVIFGFVSASFGCPEINFLDNNYSEIYINCDNRH